MKRTRHDARECALQILFQWDVHHNTDYWLEDFWAQREVEAEVREFTDGLVQGVMDRKQDIDALITEHATNWTINRMPIVDRNILRLSLYELIWYPDVPAKVTVNEAIELAKDFADDEAKRFINGILDSVLRKDVRLETKRADIAKETSGSEASG